MNFKMIQILFMFCSFLFTYPVYAANTNTLQDISYTPIAGNKIRLNLSFTDSMSAINSFITENPARIILDFPGTESKVAKRNLPIDIGSIESARILETKDRLRVVVNLLDQIPYDVKTVGKDVHVYLNASSLASKEEESSTKTVAYFSGTKNSQQVVRQLLNVDFRRDKAGAGKVILALSDPKTPVDITQQGKKIKITLIGANVSNNLLRRLDVIDFGTPVNTIDTVKVGKDTIITVTADGYFDQMVYQTDNQLLVEVQPLTKQEKEIIDKNKSKYSGKRLSLNFQDIEVRAVLQLVADFTGLNIVASDTVGGNVTLRLQNVPWDQALEIILRSKGLAKRQQGNVIMIAPSEEIAAREKLELEANQQVSELAPLQSEFISVNYAKASDIASLLKDEANSLLSARGNVSVDGRTNTLLVQDTAQKLIEIRKIVATLDLPVKQVEIEARIVSATDDFSRNLGIRWGVSGVGRYKNFIYASSGSQDVATDQVSDRLTNSTNTPVTSSTPKERYNIDLGIDNAPKIAFSIGKLGRNLPFLDLELSAAQTESIANIIASPRLITSNQKEAVIKQGKEVPYQEKSSSGATSIAFREAVLELRVTPQITPDRHIIMDLIVKQDSINTTNSTVPSNETPIIDTQEVQTQVLVQNGETIVLGGIYQRNRSKGTTKVPFFGNLPLVGNLFKDNKKSDSRTELLIFVTPKIISQSTSLGE